MDKSTVRWLVVAAVLAVGVGASAAAAWWVRQERRFDLDQFGADRDMHRREVVSS